MKVPFTNLDPIPMSAPIRQLANLPVDATHAELIHEACMMMYRTGDWQRAKKHGQRVKAVKKLLGNPFIGWAMDRVIRDFYDTVVVLERSSSLGAIAHDEPLIRTRTQYSAHYIEWDHE